MQSSPQTSRPTSRGVSLLASHRASLRIARGFAAGLLPVAFVGLALPARCGDERAVPPRPQPKSLAAEPRAIFRLALSLLFFAALSARAQFLTADDFFNSGAQFYISNNIPLAKKQTEMGLQIYPKDDKLKKLEALLKQQQQSQNNQSQQNQQNQSQQSQQNQQKGQQSKDQHQHQQQASQSQSDKDKEKEKEQQAQKEDAQKKEDEKKAQEEQAKSGDKSGDETNEVADAKGAHPMTPKEAERLLNAQKGNEQYLAMKPKDKAPPPNRPVKDW